MIVTKRLIYWWLILFLPFLVAKLYLAHRESKLYEIKYTSAVANHRGQKFDFGAYLDANKKLATLDLAKSNRTIVDFWFSDCPPCLQEMKQFPALVKGREKDVQIVSISINSFAKWKEVLQAQSGPFAFLSHRISNWDHLVMKSNEDPRLNNDIPADNTQALMERFQSGNFPMYFVLDREGTIIATPFSAVDYIRDSVLKESTASSLMTDRRTWSLLSTLAPRSFVEYSGYFWILVLSGYGIRRAFKGKRSPTRHS